jgi:MFS family permease
VSDRERTDEAVEAKQAGRHIGRTEDTVQLRPSEYIDLLRNKDFFRLWMGQMISAIGDWVIVAALFALVDEKSGGKSSAISLMMVARFLPAMLLGFLAGVIIDRFDRKATMISCDLARAALVMVLPFSNSLLMICVLVFLMETFMAIYGPAKDASIPDLVRPDQLTNANSLNSVTLFASMAFGTAIAGLMVGLIAWLGNLNPGFIGKHFDANSSACFLDSISFLTSAFLISRISFRKRGPEQIVKFSSSQVKTDVKDGIKYMWTHPLTRIVFFLEVICFLAGGTIYVLAVGFVKYVLGGGNATFMAVLTTLLFGLMAGSLLAGLLKGILDKEKWLGWAVVAFGTCLCVFALISWFWITFVLAFLAGMFMGYAVVGMITLLHETLEEEYRGRVFSTVNMLMRTSIFLAVIIAGPLADLINWLGRTWGQPAQSWFFIRIGGAFAGQVDDRFVDFRYLLNGPQIILLAGGMVILMAGLYAHKRLGALFSSPEGLEMLNGTKAAYGMEPITLAETPPGGEAGGPEPLAEEVQPPEAPGPADEMDKGPLPDELPPYGQELGSAEGKSSEDNGGRVESDG